MSDIQVWFAASVTFGCFPGDSFFSSRPVAGKRSNQRLSEPEGSLEQLLIVTTIIKMEIVKIIIVTARIVSVFATCQVTLARVPYFL